MGLSFRPRVLLLDEPLAALDDETKTEMYALFVQFNGGQESPPCT